MTDPGLGIAAVLAADAGLDLRTGPAALGDGDLDELADAGLVEGGERVPATRGLSGTCTSPRTNPLCAVIYLDHNATTPLLLEGREAMLPILGEAWGNPSSSYRFGSRMKSRIERAREQVAALVGARSPREIVFTSGGTEANNTALHAALVSQPGKRHLITSAVEHSSVLTCCKFLEKHHGVRVTNLPVDADGRPAMADLEEAITDETALVSLMWAKNETGVLGELQRLVPTLRGKLPA